jgi:hypothetical protein
MGRDSNEGAKANKDTGQERVEKALAACTSNLWGALKYDAPTACYGISLSHRGASGWLAVARAYDKDGNRVVCFGGDSTPVGALCRLSGNIGKAQWRPDRYANEDSRPPTRNPQERQLALNLNENR